MRFTVPNGACDTHMHIYGTPGRSHQDYLALRNRLGITRSVYVQPSVFSTDNTLLLECLVSDGNDARGVAVIDPEADDSELDRLDQAGIRGVRFHDVVAGCLSYEVLESVAARIVDWGWHVIIQSEGERLADLAPRLARLPVPVVVDHMGRIPLDGGIAHPAYISLLHLLETGRVWVKLSAPYHVTREYGRLADRGRGLVNAAPERMLWASNWPHPSVSNKDRPDEATLLDILFDWAETDAILHRILVDNPADLYGF